MKKKIEKLKQSISLLDKTRKETQYNLLLKGKSIRSPCIYFVDQLSTKLTQGIEELNARKQQVNAMLNQVEHTQVTQKENALELSGLNKWYCISYNSLSQLFIIAIWIMKPRTKYACTLFVWFYLSFSNISLKHAQKSKKNYEMLWSGNIQS